MDTYSQEDIDIECLLHGDGSIPILDGHRPKMPDKVREVREVREVVYRHPIHHLSNLSSRVRIPVAPFSTSKSQSSNSQSSCPHLSFSSSKGSLPGDQTNCLRERTDADAVPRYFPKITHATRLDNGTSPAYEPMSSSDAVFGAGSFFVNMFEPGPLFDIPPDPVPFLAEFRPRPQTPQASASPDKPDLDGAEATDQSADDEANSPHSSGGTDYEDSLLGCTGYAGSCCEQSVNEEEIIRPILDPVKRALIDRVMVEFHALFEASWTTNATQQAASGSHSQNSSHVQTSGNSSKSSLPTNKNGKHRMAHRDIGGPDDDDDDNNHPKRKKVNSTPPDTTNDRLKFACPFHKHDPRKYCTNSVTGITYRACSGPGWVEVYRIKEHLYRRHRAPIQCRRCWSTFNNELELQNHVRDADGCELRPEQPIEGITGKMERELRSKKKMNSDLDEEGKWKNIYEILFPDESIPTPYYEPAEYSDPGSPASRAIANYEEFSKRQLPHLVRRRLEAAAENEALTIEEKLKTILVDIVKDCQGFVYLLYQRQTVAMGSTEATEADPTDTTPSLPSSQANTAAHQEPQTGIMNETVTSVFHPNTPQGNISARCPELPPNPPTFPQAQGQPSVSESGYGSLQSACKCRSSCHCGASEFPDASSPTNPGDEPLPPEPPAEDNDCFEQFLNDWGNQ